MFINMKKILVLCVAAILLAVPVSFAQNHKDQKGKAEKTEKVNSDIETVTFSTNMSCKNCVKKINENISFEKGVKGLDVSLEDQRISVKYDKRKTTEDAIAASIKKLGYKAEKVK